jgi:dipeptidyl aminopeptidase/acylaminoacyl peptidase
MQSITKQETPGHLPPIIPREILFGNPERAMPQLSPDGKRLAYLAPHNGVLNVWLRTVGAHDDRVITNDTRRGIRKYFWSEDNTHLLYLQDKDGDENWHLYAVQPDSGVIRDITPHEGIQAQPFHTDRKFPGSILVGLNIRDKRLHDVYLIDIATGKEERVAENPGDVVEWIADHEFHVRALLAQAPDGGFILRIRDTVSSPWRQLVKFAPEDGFPSISGFTPNNTNLYAADPRNWNATRLVEISAIDGSDKVIASDPRYDVGSLMIHPTSHHIQGVSFYKERNEWIILDHLIDEDFRLIEDIAHGDPTILSRNRADSVWLVAYIKDNGPVPYYLFDRQTKHSTFLFTNRPPLEHFRLSTMDPVSFPARDGLTLEGYLTLPPGKEPLQLPLVLTVHGGPWARDTWGLNAEAQWLANRGYACLQVNYRGSTGYGKDFLNAGNKEWGAKMHTDLIDAVEWAIERGIADRKQIAIYGGSYGGYAALAGAAFTPDVFCCSISVVGPSNLITLINSIPPYWEPMIKQFHQRVGDPATEEEFLKSRSPLFSAGHIRIPMLIAQGANDPRVKQAESEQIVAALKAKGKEVDYMLFPDEGHGFARPENRLKFYAEAEKFLGRHLGGRVEAD